MKKSAYKDLDPTSRSQLNNLNQDAQIAELTSLLNEVNKRVGILEAARTVQRQLNAKFETQMILPEPLQRTEKLSMWAKIWK